MFDRFLCLPVVTALVLLISVAGAHAGERRFPHAKSPSKPSFSRAGVYLGLGGSYAIDMAMADELDAELAKAGFGPVSVDSKNSFGGNIRAGYRGSPNFAVEAQVEYIVGLDTDVEYDPTRSAELTFSALTTTANAKLFLLTGRVQPFLLGGVGLAYGMVDGDSSAGASLIASGLGFAVRGGGGLDVYLTPNILVNADVSYVLPTGQLRYFDYLSIGFGLQYRF